MTDIALPNTGVPGLPGERLLSDEMLAKLTGRGSERAFAALYERHHQALYRYCRSIVRNDHDAQDALQSAMMRAYAALSARERELAVRPWLFRIAHNEAISILRRRGAEHESSDREQIDGDVEHTLEVRERLARLVADLQALPERQRGALLMRELSGLSIEEIAGALSVSPGVAKQSLFEARSSLHEISEGRAMPCEAVREAISRRDGRVLRGRRLRAHLRACEGCRDFRAAIGARGADLRVLAPPLPISAAGAILARLLAHGGGGHAGGAAAVGSGGAATASSGGIGAAGSGAGGGATLGGHAATSMIVKGVAGAMVLATATTGAVRLTAARHERGTVVEKISTSAHVMHGKSSTGVPDLRAGFSSGSSGSRASIGSSLLHGGTSAGGASSAGAARAQTRAAGLERQGDSLGAANHAALGGRSGVGSGAGEQSRGRNQQAGGRSPRDVASHRQSSHRLVKPRESAPSPSHESHRSRRGESVAKPQAPKKDEAPKPAATSSRESARSEHEPAGAQPPTGTSGEARQTATREPR